MTELAIVQALASPPADQPATPAPETDLREVLQQHTAWLEFNGEAGRQADLTRARLEGADLTDANLREAVLNRVNLRGADLLLANFQGASLLEADLRDANLLGSNLQETDLQGATLEGATGLLSGQLAGANLFGATLPASLSLSEAMKQVGKVGQRAGWLALSMLALNALVWLRIATTQDARLLTDAATLPLPGMRNVLPLVSFYLFCPVLILCLYVYLHLYLQRLWEGIAALPAIFPDGERLDACVPWFARWPVRRHVKWLNLKWRPSFLLEAAISSLALYWVVPATLVLFWARFLTLQQSQGTILHIALVLAAVSASYYSRRMVRRTFKADPLHIANWKSAFAGRNVTAELATLLAIAVVLSLLSLGTILGAPHEINRTGQPAASGVRTWAAEIFRLVGYNPFAQMAETDVSQKPPGWTGEDAQLADVGGARLNGLSLRYVQAYGAFLARANLRQADLRNAHLSDADLREANLRQADLRSARLERARLNRAILQKAVLQDANLTQADLRDANLSFAHFDGAVFLDAKLEGAVLYGSDFSRASFQRADLQKADVRETILQGADLTMSNLREADFTSAKMMGAKLHEAQLVRALLLETDLRNADLSGSNLQGALLRGADLTGANLQGADLRGATGLNAWQVCRAANLRFVLLDEGLQREVESQCPNNR
jgi:uncharacterized protein YjbI with pentapeptide repeats